MNSNWQRLIDDCTTELKSNGVTISLVPRRSVRVPGENVCVGGYWNDSDENNLILSCATLKPINDWGSTFVHEFCHFLQWKEQTKLWKDNFVYTLEDTNKVFRNKPVTQKFLHRYLKLTRDLELDCERRTVARLRQYHIPIDIGQYIREANVYIHFYNYAREYRRWYPENNPPHYNRLLLDTASTRFYRSYDKIPKTLADAFKKTYPIKHKSNICE